MDQGAISVSGLLSLKSWPILSSFKTRKNGTKEGQTLDDEWDAGVADLVHIAPEQLVVPLEPLYKPLWCYDPSLALLRLYLLQAQAHKSSNVLVYTRHHCIRSQQEVICPHWAIDVYRVQGSCTCTNRSARQVSRFSSDSLKLLLCAYSRTRLLKGWQKYRDCSTELA